MSGILKNSKYVKKSDCCINNVSIGWNNMQINGKRGTINTNEDGATAFWIRRNIDRTTDEFENLLRTILKIYEPDKID